MELSAQVMSDIIVHNKYARFVPEVGRRETWDEIVDRNMNMHLNKYRGSLHKVSGGRTLHDNILSAYDRVRRREILPSMRSLQFGGKAIERNPARIYNCAYAPVDHPDFFSELMFLLLGGTGMGYSVQLHHVGQLPRVQKPNIRRRRYKIGDSIEGWADSVKVLVEAYFYGKDRPRFDYSDIREKGTELVVTGGKAPGPAPLRVALAKIEGILESNVGKKLTPLQVHDICCHIADAVLAGGIRRAAMIALFSKEDFEMMNCKAGMWWDQNPQRGRANNSVVLHREYTTEEEFYKIWEQVRLSGSGEPGIYWTNNYNLGTNPCAEISLKPFQFCNLVEVNVSTGDSDSFYVSCIDASLLATLQAGYTDFHYLRPIWKETTEEEALIGVGHTGIASCELSSDQLKVGAALVKEVNADVAKLIGINPAARTTTVKPSGTSSLVLGTSSGIHAWHNDYYLRRVKLNKDEALFKFLKEELPEFVEDDLFSNSMGFACIPMKAPDNAITRLDEDWRSLFDRAIKWNVNWVHEGHRSGANTNNVSTTISLKEEDWEPAGKAMWEYRHQYNGMSVLPYDGGTYKQTPFEDISKDKYESLAKLLHALDMTKVKEVSDNTDLTGEAACAGGACEVTF